MQTHAHLPEIVGATRPTRRLAGSLHRRQKQSHQNPDDGNHNEQFHQRKGGSLAHVRDHSASPRRWLFLQSIAASSSWFRQPSKSQPISFAACTGPSQARHRTGARRGRDAGGPRWTRSTFTQESLPPHRVRYASNRILYTLRPFSIMLGWWRTVIRSSALPPTVFPSAMTGPL